MNTEKNNKNLDELITGAIGRDGLKFAFNKWNNRFFIIDGIIIN